MKETLKATESPIRSEENVTDEALKHNHDLTKVGQHIEKYQSFFIINNYEARR